tara:strand:+ start:20932 stop:21078 length:147 start_codon:yes stop_codon:yes gene_type:complete
VLEWAVKSKKLVNFDASTYCNLPHPLECYEITEARGKGEKVIEEYRNI